MKKLLISTGLLLTASLALAQPQKPTYAYYEGFNLSMGIAQNNTKDVTNSTSLSTSVGQSKLNYTFALAYPAKLGVSATFDMRNSQINSSENLATSTPTELTIEPGVLLMSNSLLYGKLGAYNARFESGSNASRNLNGTSFGASNITFTVKTSFKPNGLNVALKTTTPAQQANSNKAQPPCWWASTSKPSQV
jgi:hypothetical protein